jgi:hypothetical protein
MQIVLTIHDPRPGQSPTRSIRVDGDEALAASIRESARATPDEILTIPGARIHVVAEPGVLTIRAGRILDVRTEH